VLIFFRELPRAGTLLGNKKIKKNVRNYTKGKGFGNMSNKDGAETGFGAEVRFLLSVSFSFFFLFFSVNRQSNLGCRDLRGWERLL
jgi:hypothetical protein